MLKVKRAPNITLFTSGELQGQVVQVPKNVHEHPIWKSLSNVFTLCTQLDPESRPSAGEILEMLDKIEKGEEISMSR